MKYEPVKDKKRKMKKNIRKSAGSNVLDDDNFYLGFEKGVSDSFDLFASAVEEYKRYKDNVKLLMKEQQKVWLEWVSYYDSKSDIDNSNYLDRYNNWLFDYAFSDIDEEKSDGLFKL